MERTFAIFTEELWYFVNSNCKVELEHSIKDTA